MDNLVQLVRNTIRGGNKKRRGAVSDDSAIAKSNHKMSPKLASLRQN